MPSLEVLLPKTDLKTRGALAFQLTKSFMEATGNMFEKKDFFVFFIEYGMGFAAAGGKLWDDEDDFSPVHLCLFCPRLSRGQKQKSVELFTRALKEAGNKDWEIVVHISEHPYDNVGVNGKLLSDLVPELAKKKFYYETNS
ncbi:MAG: hypothetical protein HZB68_05960 [Candidatus Aenigmarchaeota archaeon]|nr:hypothetical protein [Candidatus Aenigmarchaeota archaeon]